MRRYFNIKQGLVVKMPKVKSKLINLVRDEQQRTWREELKFKRKRKQL